ncbi:MFS transporter [Granulicoccus phenolivorans]|uniref:MFS transporter n=1 Tax=Granulicoccus phenolivorans TaxID=266854 RepID=UPI000B0F358D|nr:MFS transporter [Granulicoccus phenolivorans]
MTSLPTPTAAEAPADAIPRRTWLSLAVVVLGMSMALLDTTIINVAIPTIRTGLDTSEATLSWIIAGYALAYGVALIPAGRIGDRIGHKPVFVTGLAGFTLASLWCGLATDPTQLVVARVVQGLAAGTFFPAVTALIQLMFPPSRRGRAFAIMGAAIGVATALGPVIGGLLIEWFGEAEGWRSIFLVNLPFGLLGVLAALVFLPRGAEDGAPHGTDLVGVLLLATGLLALFVPLIQGEEAGWPLWTYLSLAGGVLLLAGFARWEIHVDRRGGSPLVPPGLFRRASFTGGVVLALAFFAAFTSIFFTISILWQAGLGHTALEAGLVSLSFAGGFIVSAALSDRLAERVGRTVLSAGTGCLTLGLVGVWLVLLLIPTVDLTAWVLLPPLALAGIGAGLFIAPNVEFIVATVERSEAGAASGVIGTAQRIGQAAGIAVIGTILFGTLDVVPSQPGPPSQADLATAFGQSATFAIATNAVLALAAFLLVFALPKEVPAEGRPPTS